MPALMPVGPFKHCVSAEGKTFPYYIVPFDKDGQCEAPLTRQHLLDHLAGHTDVFFFSHGWNNGWEVASARYANFIDGYTRQRTALGLKVPDNYNPLLVGIFWPSQALAWFDNETGPRFAGSIEEGREQVLDIAQSLPATQREAFLTLAQTPRLTSQQAGELAGILADALKSQHDDEGLQRSPPSAQDLLVSAIVAAEPEPDYDQFGVVRDVPQTPPTPAGVIDALKSLDPRQLIKPFTVWQMKDRAGKVGSAGVSRLLADILATNTEASVHLLGHSYGCKVVMSATANLPAGVRKIHSALLLQPAISQYAFAEKIPDSTLQGGYRVNLARITRPVVATFSSRDSALSQAFHLALRRDLDLGEQPSPAGSPSKYGALGGFGPQPPQEPATYIKDPLDAYDFGAGGRVVGIQGSRTISGHGDISNPSTWWLAYSLASSQDA
ncbi:hypothetical protein DYL59_26535 [Pseudomonas kairouanensis]|uniref:Alpha/beta hydrolase n=1 Tax=Pseudomonas kairouanensis TaxID=2293832 RepID=A0A4Z0AFA6_9PSED|nr:hypothetical protein [Pseudomonas kairouanensis]TFY85150.1 hypothetical protein DYL59_26535 [Pseudomonas kairouanensis]